MSENNTTAFPEVANIQISDICGFLEVVQICNGDNKVSFPWLDGRFMFNFLEQNIFLSIKGGECNHGTWKLKRKALKTNNRFSIILNGTSEYKIMGVDEDEIILTDCNSKYFLTRRL